MGINLQINQTKQQIINILNQSNLPISIIHMLLNEISIQIERVEREVLNKEYQQEQEKQKQTQQTTSESQDITD